MKPSTHKQSEALVAAMSFVVEYRTHSRHDLAVCWDGKLL
jgi:hypothetical protein